MKQTCASVMWTALLLLYVYGLGTSARAESATASYGSPCIQIFVLEPLDLSIALKQAYRENPRVISAQQDIEKALAGEKNAISAFYPTISASIIGERFVNNDNVNDVATVGTTVVGGQHNQYTNYPSVSVNWNIYNGGRDTSALHAAQAAVRASTSDMDNQFNDTFTEIITAYNELMKAQVLFIQRSNAVQVKEGMVRRSHQRFERDSGTLIALNQVRVAHAQAERDSFKSCRDIVEKSAALAQAIGIGMPMRHAFTLIAPLPEAPKVAFNESEVESLIQNDPAVIAARERKLVAEQKLRQTRSALYPTLALMARYDWLGQKSENYSDAWNDTRTNSYRYGFILQQPLFPYVGYKGGVQGAMADLIKADASYHEAVITAEAHLHNAMSAKSQAEAAEKSAQISAEEARQALILSKELYARGHADLDTVDHAKLDAGQEEEVADEAITDRLLNEWLVFKSLHPNDFAHTLLDAADETSLKIKGSR